MLLLSKSTDPDQRETQRLVWVYTFCICPNVPFRMTLANYYIYCILCVWKSYYGFAIIETSRLKANKKNVLTCPLLNVN